MNDVSVFEPDDNPPLSGFEFQREHHRIGGIDFSDLYIGLNNCWMCGVSGSEVDPVQVDYIYTGDINNLRAACVEMEKKTGVSDFSVRYDDVCYRVSVMPSLAGDVYVLRRFPNFIPDFSKLGIHPGIIEKLMRPGLTGMILIAGATGSGKTTTASSLIKKRLLEYGGVAVTAEDPPEMPLEGTHSKDSVRNSICPKGICYQTMVPPGDNGYAEAAKKMLRWKPNIIFLGEVRNGPAAVEALKASINGHLVITTVHSDDVVTAIARMNSMAEDAGAGSSSMLADGLVAVLHQKLEGEPKRLKTQFLFLADDSAIGASKLIRDKRFEMLTTEINAQSNRMMYQEKNIASS